MKCKYNMGRKNGLIFFNPLMKFNGSVSVRNVAY